MATINACKVKAQRQARGLSQRTLSEAAGITRQAVGAIESGRMQPSVGIALGLARALGTSVEDLFGSGEESLPNPKRVARAAIGGRTVTHALDQDHLAIEPADSALPCAFVGGCDLAIGLLSRHATARSCDVRVLWLPMTNHAALAALSREARTLVVFEAPHRIAATLADLAQEFGGDRAAVVARELTKAHETIYRGTLAELAARARSEANFARGEITLVVHGASPAAAGVDERLLRHAVDLLTKELPPGRAAAIAAALTGATRAAAYALATRGVAGSGSAAQQPDEEDAPQR